MVKNFCLHPDWYSSHYHTTKNPTAKNVLSAILSVLLFLFSSHLQADAANATTSKEFKDFINNNRHLSSENLFTNGLRCIAESKPDSALAYYAIALARYDNDATGSDAHTLGSIYNNIGYIYLYVYNDCVQAYEYFIKALETQEKSDDKELKPYILLNIGNVFAMFNDQTTAIDSYKKAFASLRLDGSDNEIASIIALNLFPDAYIEGRVPEITSDLNKFLAMPEAGGLLEQSARLVAQGIRDEQTGHRDRETFKAALEIYDKDPNADRRIRTSLAFMEAESSVRSGDINHSIQILRDILHSSIDDGAIDLAAVAAYNLSNCYSMIQMPDSADHFRLRNLDLRDSLLNMGNFGKIKDIHSMHLRRYAQEEIRILALKERNRTNLLILSGIASFILLTLLAIIVVKNKKLKTQNEYLFQHARRLSDKSEDSSGDVIDINESEQSNNTITEQQTSKIVSDEIRDTLKEEISRVFRSEDIFSPDFSLDRLAFLVNSKTRYVSSVINECFGCSFNQKLGEIRITRACHMLADRQYDKFTIQHIAESLGFKSRSNFGALFKKTTGLTPGEYHSIAVKKRKTEPESC